MSVILAGPQTALISVRHLKSIITNLFLTKSNFPRQNSACLHFVKNIWGCQQFFVNNRFYQAGQFELWPVIPSFNPSTQSNFFPRVIRPLQIAVLLKSCDSSVLLLSQILPCADLTLVGFSLSCNSVSPTYYELHKRRVVFYPPLALENAHLKTGSVDLDALKSQGGRAWSLSHTLSLIWDVEDRTSELLDSCNPRFQDVYGKFCTYIGRLQWEAGDYCRKVPGFESSNLDLRSQLHHA